MCTCSECDVTFIWRGCEFTTNLFFSLATFFVPVARSLVYFMISLHIFSVLISMLNIWFFFALFISIVRCAAISAGKKYCMLLTFTVTTGGKTEIQFKNSFFFSIYLPTGVCPNVVVAIILCMECRQASNVQPFTTTVRSIKNLYNYCVNTNCFVSIFIQQME